MIANWLKILLFGAGVVTAAVGTVWYTGIYDPWASPNAASQVASAPDTSTAGDTRTDENETAASAQEGSADTPQGDTGGAEIAAPEADEPGEMTQTGEGENLAIPSFHVVRVEPNGSMVIAGSAEPNSQVEVVAGAHVIARAEVGPSGDFAAVLDDALDPGDYQIVLRSTGPGEGSVTTSVETAIVSVPDDESGQVLALVEEPGAASRLITVPEGEEMQAEAAADEEAERQIAAAGADDGASSEDETTADTDTSGPQAEADASAGETASADTQGGETQSRPSTPRSALAVEAIEIERDAVFVAGRGTAGTTIRVYANDMLLGEARVSEAGRFLIESQTDLPVGDYIVRADVIGPGGEVTARAAVPFQREPGETVAAVAPREPAANAQNEAGAETGSEGNGARQGGSSELAPTSGAGGSPSQGAVAGADSASIEETMAPGLQSVDGSVIIRRGDSLWRISRRVYGRGVRYSTIYLANQDQIRNPDRIWPGQIFEVPEETAEGERADMNAVSDQIAPQTSTE
ncbi:LysM peptidoglycan-binding domain-containing protein [Aliihoeflea sp. PC F10.4]